MMKSFGSELKNLNTCIPWHFAGNL